MRAFLQIVKLELISAVRSKMMILFAVSSAAWMIFGRNFIKGDVADVYQLSVRYLLGTVFGVVLLSLGSAAAGVLSTDRAAKRLQLTMIRPVPYSVVAMARSVALTVVGSAVLAFALILLWAFEGRGRMCDRIFSPVLEDPLKAAEAEFDEMYASNEELRRTVDEVGDKTPFIKYLESRKRNQYADIAPGATASWEFKGVPENADNVSARVRLLHHIGLPGAALGTFSFRGLSGEVDGNVKTRFSVPLDSGSGDVSGGNSLSFTNNSNTGLTLQPRNDLKLLVRADSFAFNAFRGWLVMTFVLMIVVSVGVFLGSCLGRGVAIFVAISLLIVMVISPSTVEDYPDPTRLNSVSRWSLRISEFSADITAPVAKFSPISSLAADEYIKWTDIGKAAASGGFYLIVFSLFSGFVMPRKQDD